MYFLRVVADEHRFRVSVSTLPDKRQTGRFIAPESSLGQLLLQLPHHGGAGLRQYPQKTCRAWSRSGRLPMPPSVVLGETNIELLLSYPNRHLEAIDRRSN